MTNVYRLEAQARSDGRSMYSVLPINAASRPVEAHVRTSVEQVEALLARRRRDALMAEGAAEQSREALEWAEAGLPLFLEAIAADEE